ncbi:CHAT domain-containing protein [Nonomuraea sp. NPDC050022]|uniref:CHAT domain-containing protein n=1 Tax=unclassified Nonomuraea TaxID=2593643 RepID=UPI003403DC60
MTIGVDERMALAREWDSLLEQVRELPEFTDFLESPSIGDLAEATSDGTVVIVNVSQWRCDALMVSRAGVRSVELPGLSRESAMARMRAYLQAVGDAHLASRSPEAMVARERMEGVLTDTLAWLWETVARPVLDAQRLSGPSEGRWPRLWWCPTGPLTLLPLHAAGGPGGWVMDRAVSSYTPTLRILAETPPAVSPEDDDRLLIVSLPETPGQPPLPGVVKETDALRKLFAGRHTLLHGDDATKANVRAELARHRWAHLSCHATQDLTTPSRGGLIVYDGRLTVTDLAEEDRKGDFAFLSACKTATGGTTLPDEAITLAAVLRYTGYRHVIATLWAVDDSVTAPLVHALYLALTRSGYFDPENAAVALHQVIRAFRAGLPTRPSLWVPFVHVGP